MEWVDVLLPFNSLLCLFCATRICLHACIAKRNSLDILGCRFLLHILVFLLLPAPYSYANATVRLAKKALACGVRAWRRRCGGTAAGGNGSGGWFSDAVVRQHLVGISADAAIRSFCA